MLLVRVVVSVLCAAGFYASVFMLRKSLLDRAGRLGEASVVQSARAKLFAGIPNALFGCVYYPALTATAWCTVALVPLGLALGAAVCAALTSVYLAYSLVFVTRRSCPYCWSAHVANWGLLAAVPWLVILR